MTISTEGKIANPDGNIHAVKSLYSNSSGTMGTITLSETSANFQTIEINYSDNNGKEVKNLRIDTPNGKTIQLDCIEPGSTANNPLRTYMRTSCWTISGTSLTHVDSTFTTLSSAGIENTSSQYIKIYKVKGYR